MFKLKTSCYEFQTETSAPASSPLLAWMASDGAGRCAGSRAARAPRGPPPPSATPGCAPWRHRYSPRCRDGWVSYTSHRLRHFDAGHKTLYLASLKSPTTIHIYISLLAWGFSSKCLRGLRLLKRLPIGGDTYICPLSGNNVNVINIPLAAPVFSTGLLQGVLKKSYQLHCNL